MKRVIIGVHASGSTNRLTDTNLSLRNIRAARAGFVGVWDQNTSELRPPEVCPRTTIAATDDRPLVSCIMPTANRAAFVLQSIRYLERQTYSPYELIIVDDGSDDLEAKLPHRQWIRYHRIHDGASIGKKRNEACKLARGKIIAHWDDDDCYSPDRLERQVAPILHGEDVTGLRDCVFFELPTWKFWSTSPSLHRKLFMEDVHGGTLVYKRKVWDRLARFPDRSLAEDGRFLRQAVQKGAKLHRLPADKSYLYVRHASSAWQVECGQYLEPGGWGEVLEPGHLSSDQGFYRAMRHPSSAASADAGVKVSCIMPTADRIPYVEKAIEYFRRQTYRNVELVVVDDGDQAISKSIAESASITYLRPDGKLTIGEKRNLACEAASGEIIVHWDDDDWMAPWRVQYQVEQLQTSKAEVCGVDKVIYFDGPAQDGYEYVYPNSGKPWVAGNSLCYYKKLWQRNRFQPINVGEDTRFLRSAASPSVVALTNNQFMVGLIHATNVSPKRPSGSRWQSFPVSKIRDLVQDDWNFYRGLERGRVEC